VVGEIPSLTHEVGNDSVEARPLESKTLFSSAETTEILCGFWYNISSQLHADATQGGTIGGHVEENAGEIGVHGVGDWKDSDGFRIEGN